MTSIPTGIDLERFVPGDATAARARLGLPERPALGVIATMRTWKGHVHLFDALAATRAAWDGWQVLVVGGGPDRAKLEEHVRRAALADLVRFTGHQDDVVPWFQALDLFVLPSYGDEGVPQAIMQAMACGIPVVSTTVGAIGEAVEAGVSGLLVEPASPPALAAALGALRDSMELRRRISLEARRKAEREFGLERMIDAMETVFRSVLRPRAD
jgi:glycosyltransferase involved in cell wall biosynthesis